MIIQKLRLQHGYSQQQLAVMSGLSTRTIQRIENGHHPSVESIKSLAAVFEIDFQTLQEAITMKPETTNHSAQTPLSTNHVDLTLRSDEIQALQRVRKIKRFYIGLFVFIMIISLLAVIDYLTSPDFWWVQWVILGWGGGLLIRALKTFDILPFFNATWEKRQVEKYLNRKL